MDTLLRRILFRGEPARGAFFSLGCAVFGCWILGALAFFLPECTAAVMPDDSSPAWRIELLLMIAFAVATAILILYAFAMNLYFYFTVKSRAWGRQHDCGLLLYCGAAWTAGYFLGFSGWYAVTATVLIWLLPWRALAQRKTRLILQNLCWSGAALAGALVSARLRHLPGLIWGVLPEAAPLLPPLAAHLVICGGALLLPVAWLLTAQTYADAAGKPFKEIFGTAAKMTPVVWGLVWCATCFAAIGAQNRADLALHDLEAFFGRPVNVAGLAERHRAAGAPDAAFWREFNVLAGQLRSRDGGRFYELFRHDFRRSRIPDALRGEQENAWNASPLPARIEALFDRPVPPAPRDFERGNVFYLKQPELADLRQFGRCEAWRLALAAHNGDREGALKAHRRLFHLEQYLTRAPFPVHGLVLGGVMHGHLEALERLLAAGLPSDDDLRMIARDLARLEDALPVVRKEVLYAEAVSAVDFYDGAAHGLTRLGEAPDTPKAPGFAPYCWLFPPLWRLIALNRETLHRNYCTDDFQAFAAPARKRGVRHLLSKAMQGALPLFGERFAARAALLPVMRALIAVELEKRRTGTYPDSVPGLPEDPFSDQPLHFRNGLMKIREVHYDDDGKLAETTWREIDAVAVWSVGVNRKNDFGLSGPRTADGGESDDILFAIEKTPRPPGGAPEAPKPEDPQ